MDNEDKTRTHVPLTAGTMVSHYRIVEKIGAGGMGEVYLAEDTGLDRRVALKFLPAGLCSDDDLKARFVREAKAAAKLNHPNIVTVYEVDDHAGRPYFAMEFVGGKTVRDLVRKSSTSVDEVIDIAIQICQGMGEAHRAGIVHRDIKSANLVVDDNGRVRILDFGLASVLGAEDITKTGSTLGTVAYMSPEQVSGRAVDHRSDLFSFGVVLYELLTRQNPFHRDNEGATLRAIMQDTPRGVRQLNSEVPELLERVVANLLEKDIELRYQTAEGVLADLKKLLYDSQPTGSSTAAVVPEVDDKAIVVVPFNNLGGDPENEFFSDGLTEELITDLSGIGDLRVISRSSAMKLKGTDKDVRVIGRELNVRYILMGSVRRAGDKVRITVQLVDAGGDEQVWADKYKGTLDDIFEIQEEVSQAIVSTLKVRLTKKEKEHLGARPIDNPRAFEFYLRARQEMHKWTEEGFALAEDYLKHGLEIAGDNAVLFAGLAQVNFQHVNVGNKSMSHIEEAREYLDRAFALDADCPQAHTVAGLIAQAMDADQTAAIDHFSKVLEVEPNDPDALFWLGLEYCMVGRPEKGRQLLERLKRIDPLSIQTNSLSIWVELMSGDLDAYLEAARLGHELDPEHIWKKRRYVYALAVTGHMDKARELWDWDEQESFYARLGGILVLGMMGEKERALACVDKATEEGARRDPQFSWFLAIGYAACDEYDKALDWLENAINKGFTNYPYLSQTDPLLARMRDLPRFQELMAVARRKWEALDV